MHTEVYKCAATLSPWTEAFCIQNSVYVFVRTVLHSKPFVIIIIENENCNGNMPNELPVLRCVRTRLSLCVFNLYLRFSSVSALNFIFLFVIFFAIEYFIAVYFHYFKNVRDILKMRTITRPTIWCWSWVCSLSSLTAFWCNNRNGNQNHFRPMMTTKTVVAAAAATTSTTITAATTVNMYSYTQTVVRNKFISLCKIFAVYHSAVWYFLPFGKF